MGGWGGGVMRDDPAKLAISSQCAPVLVTQTDGCRPDILPLGALCHQCKWQHFLKQLQQKLQNETFRDLVNWWPCSVYVNDNNNSKKNNDEKCNTFSNVLNPSMTCMGLNVLYVY